MVATTNFSIVIVPSSEMDTIQCHNRCSFLLLMLSKGKLLVTYDIRFAKIKSAKLIKFSMLCTVRHYYSGVANINMNVT